MNDRVQLMIDNPREAVKHSWSREPAFYDRFLARVLSIVDADPRAGKGPAKTALLHSPTACHQVQGFGLWAQVHRAIGELDTADAAIKDGFFYADGCPACIADLHRRRANLRKARRNFPLALEDANEAVRLYLKLGQPGHDLQKNGLASSYSFRASIYFYMDRFGLAASDYREALGVLDPKVSPALYRIVLANLAAALQATGRRSDLLEAEKYLKKARRLFKGAALGGQEWAKLAWLTAQVRYQLKKGQPCILKGMMEDALDDFLALGLHLEAISVAADLMKMKLARRRWGRGEARVVIREILTNLSQRLPGIPVEVCATLGQAGRAVDASGFDAKDALKTAIDDLREACSPAPDAIACLVTWDQAS